MSNHGGSMSVARRSIKHWAFTYESSKVYLPKESQVSTSYEFAPFDRYDLSLVLFARKGDVDMCL